MKGMWLTIHYGSGYDIQVRDPDQYSFLCLLQDLEECGHKQNVIPAKNPVVKYYPVGLKSLTEITGDVQLQRMFRSYKNKDEIDLYIENSETPSDGVKMYLNLKKFREEREREVEEKRKKWEEEQVRMREQREREEAERARKEREMADFVPIGKAVPIYDVGFGGEPVITEYCEVDVVTGKLKEGCARPCDIGPTGGASHQNVGTQQRGKAKGSGPSEKASEKGKSPSKKATATPIKKPQSNTQPRKKLTPKRKAPSRVTKTPSPPKHSQIEPTTPTHREPSPPIYTQPTQTSPSQTQQPQSTTSQPQQTQPPPSPQQTQPPPSSQQDPQSEQQQQPVQSEQVYPLRRRVPTTTAKRRGTFRPKVQTGRKNQPPTTDPPTDPPATETPRTDPPTTATPTTEPTPTETPKTETPATEHTPTEPTPTEPTPTEPEHTHRHETEPELEPESENRPEPELGEGANENVEWSESLESRFYNPANLHKFPDVGEGNDDEEEGYLQRVYKNGQVYQQMPWGEIELVEWDIFLDKEHCLDAIRDFSVQQGVDLVREKVDAKRFRAVCANEDCNWRIHASVLPDKVSWAIKVLSGPHTCYRLERTPMAGIKWLAHKLLEDVRANFEIPVTALISLAIERYGVNVPKSTMYKARAEAVKQIQGSHDESYSKLPQYIRVIQEADPKARAYISWLNQGPESPLTFRRMFLSFKAQYKGFVSGCRPLIGIDGCHLKGNFNGCLLSAVALDGNQQIFPLAYAVVSEESTDNWTYFFRCLSAALRGSGASQEDWIFMSDRMRGVENCIANEFPRASRRICCRHLFKNFSNKFAGPAFEEYFWQAADAFNEFVFLKAMEKIKKLDAAAYHYLNDINLELWCRFKFDPRVCCPDNTNNFTESWNATLGLDRVRPILGLLEGIRRSCMVRIGTRQAQAESWHPQDMTPHAKEQIKIAGDDSRMCTLHLSGRGKYEVVEGKTYFPIDLVNMWCKCGKWQITGLPCKHAMRVINNNRLNPHLYVSEYYSVAKYKMAYDLNMPPMPDHSQWPAASAANLPKINPPEVKRTVGRPPRNRRRQVGEQRKGKRSTTVKCSKCGESGHNKNGCMGGLTAKQKKASGKQTTKKRGREEGMSTQGDEVDVTATKKKKQSKKTKKN